MTAEIEAEDQGINIVIKRSLSPLIQVEVEPVGKWFYLYESCHNRGYLVSNGSASEDESGDEELKEEIEIEDDIIYLRSLNPADWKNQDHYAVLGLKNYRYKASDESIRKAYRAKVLRHHPDKRRGAGEDVREDDDYFTCITKAYETLGIPSRRRAYDSVDPEFDDSIPAVNDYNKEHFFQVFASVFERNARWSCHRHVPGLGKPDDPKEKVERFYNFWYEFDSWREFSYLDEEDKEKAQDRDERKWIEKQNRIARAQRRKEEMSRLRKLVDVAYACDQRIVKFKEEERQRKLEQKRVKQDALNRKYEEELKKRQEIEAAERKLREKAEAELKAKLDAEKKQRDIHKKSLKKEKKILRSLCKEKNYYTNNEKERVQLMADVEYLCEALELAKLEDLNKDLGEVGIDMSAGKNILLTQSKAIKEKVERDREEVAASSTKNCSSAGGDKAGGKNWTQSDLQLLIKAVNLFPAGTTKRWEVVAQYLNQHSTSGQKRVAKDALHKAKELQHSDQYMKEAANKNAYRSLEACQTVKISDETASQRLETPQEMLGINALPWNAEEQKLLEQALKTYPSTVPDRWEAIAACIPNRSKKDCMRRYKELVEMIKAKKAAQAAACK